MINTLVRVSLQGQRQQQAVDMYYRFGQGKIKGKLSLQIFHEDCSSRLSFKKSSRQISM